MKDQLYRKGSRIGWLLLPIPWIWRRCWDWETAWICVRIAFSPEKRSKAG